MTFKSFGYVKKEVEVREMCMGDVILTICRGMVKRDKKDIQIRIVDTYMGEVSIYKNMDDLLSRDWSGSWRVNVLETALMHNNKDNYDYLKIVIRDDVEMMEEV